MRSIEIPKIFIWLKCLICFLPGSQRNVCSTVIKDYLTNKCLQLFSWQRKLGILNWVLNMIYHRWKHLKSWCSEVNLITDLLIRWFGQLDEYWLILMESNFFYLKIQVSLGVLTSSSPGLFVCVPWYQYFWKMKDIVIFYRHAIFTDLTWILPKGCYEEKLWKMSYASVHHRACSWQIWLQFLYDKIISFQVIQLRTLFLFIYCVSRAERQRSSEMPN